MRICIAICKTIVKHAKALLRETQELLGLTIEKAVDADTQQIANRVVAAVAVVAAVLLVCIPGDKVVLGKAANALFGVAMWLWNGKEPGAVPNRGTSA